MHRCAAGSPFDVDIEQVVADAVSAAPHEHLRLSERREGRSGLDVGVTQHRPADAPVGGCAQAFLRGAQGVERIGGERQPHRRRPVERADGAGEVGVGGQCDAAVADDVDEQFTVAALAGVRDRGCGHRGPHIGRDARDETGHCGGRHGEFVVGQGEGHRRPCAAGGHRCGELGTGCDGGHPVGKLGESLRGGGLLGEDAGVGRGRGGHGRQHDLRAAPGGAQGTVQVGGDDRPGRLVDEPGGGEEDQFPGALVRSGEPPRGQDPAGGGVGAQGQVGGRGSHRQGGVRDEGPDVDGGGVVHRQQPQHRGRCGEGRPQRRVVLDHGGDRGEHGVVGEILRSRDAVFAQVGVHGESGVAASRGGRQQRERSGGGVLVVGLGAVAEAGAEATSKVPSGASRSSRIAARKSSRSAAQRCASGASSA